MSEGTFPCEMACHSKEKESNQEMGLFPDCFFFSPSEDRPAVLPHERSTDFFDLRFFYYFLFVGVLVIVVPLQGALPPAPPQPFEKG